MKKVTASTAVLRRKQETDRFGRHRVTGIFTAKKLANRLAKIDPDLDLDITDQELLGVTGAGSVVGCSGWITDPKTGRTIYVDTCDPDVSEKSGTALLKLTETSRDGGLFSSKSAEDGPDLYRDFPDLPAAIIALLHDGKLYR